MNPLTLFSFQGYFRLADRLSTGKPGVTYDVGNVSASKLTLATSSVDKNESQTGQRLQIGVLYTGKKAKLELTMDQWSARNLALGLYGSATPIDAGTVTDEALPDDLVVGDEVRLDHPFTSDIVITDSAGSPATLVLDTDYELVTQGHASNMIRILDLGAYTQPLKAAYSYEAVESVAMFTTPPAEKFVIFDGINTENNEPVLIDLYRAKFDPIADLDLIQDGYGALKMTAAILYDGLSAPDTVLGGFGRMIQKQLT